MTVWNSGLANFINNPKKKTCKLHPPPKKKRKKPKKNPKNTHTQKTVIFEKNYF